MVEEALVDCNTCSQELFADELIIQPMGVVVDTAFALCVGCFKHFDSSMYKLETNFTQPFMCTADQASDFGMSLSPIVKNPVKNLSLSVPVLLFLKRQYLSRYISVQTASLYPSSALSGEMQDEEVQFRHRLRSGCQTVKDFEDPVQQSVARSVIDINKVCIYAEEYKTQFSISSASLSPHSSLHTPPPTAPPDVCWMHGLMRWFKVDFFQWCNKPPCDHCTALGTAAPPKAGMEMIGMAEPTAFELETCWAHRVEVNFTMYDNI